MIYGSFIAITYKGDIRQVQMDEEGVTPLERTFDGSSRAEDTRDGAGAHRGVAHRRAAPRRLRARRRLAARRSPRRRPALRDRPPSRRLRARPRAPHPALTSPG